MLWKRIVSIGRFNNGFFIWVGMVLTSMKNHVLRCWDCLALPNWICAFTMSPSLKLPLRKLEPCPILWIFILGYALALPVYHKAWNERLMRSISSWICWIRYSPLTASIEPLVHRRNVASLSCYKYSFELMKLVPLPFFQGTSTFYSGLYVFGLFLISFPIMLFIFIALLFVNSMTCSGF